MAKAALSLSELSELWIPELNAIDFIEHDQRMILHAQTDIERNADGMLIRGMESHNQNQIGIAIQVFHNLAMLKKKLDKVIDEQIKQVKEKLSSALDVKKISSAAEATAKHKGSMSVSMYYFLRSTLVMLLLASGGMSQSSAAGPGKATIPAPVNMATFRAIMWTNIETVLDLLQSKTGEVMSLQQVLTKKRDVTSHVVFADILAQSDGSDDRSFNLLTKFWGRLVVVVREGFGWAVSEPNFLKQALEGEYPKLLRLFNDLWSRVAHLRAESGLEMEHGDPFETSAMDADFRGILESFERAYLSRSLSRLFDPVNLMFSTGDLPTDDELNQVFKGISSELNVALFDQRLCFTGTTSSNKESSFCPPLLV